MSEHDHHHHCEIARAIDRFTRVVDKIFGKPKNNRARFDLSIGQPEPKEERKNMLAVKISNEQKVKITLTPKTDTGKPAKLDGAPVWTVVSGDSTVVPAPDGLSADLVSSDTPGDTVFLVDADADLGTGVEDLQETITLTVTGANAKNLGLSADAPVPK